MCTNNVNRKVTEHALRATGSEVRVVPLTPLHYHSLICYVSFILRQIPVESIYKQCNKHVITYFNHILVDSGFRRSV